MISRKPSSPPEELRIDGGAYALMEQQARKACPAESCGVLLADPETGRIRDARGMKNRAERNRSGWYYRMDPPALFRLEQQAEAEGFGIAGFWHSHVEAEAVPSEEDERYMVPGMIYLILPVYGGRPGRGRAYRKKTTDGEPEEIRVRIKEKE